MPRKRGVTIVPTPPLPPPSPDDELEEDFPPEPDALGDLAFFADADDDVTWGVERLKTNDEIRQNPRGKNRVFVTKIDGRVDLVSFQAEHGGGVFRFYGKRGNGAFYGAKNIELGGPRKDYNTVPVSLTPAAPLPPAVDPALAALITEVRELKAAMAAKSNGGSITELVTALATLDNLRSRHTQPPPQNEARMAYETMMAVLTKGMELGAGREPLEDSGAATVLKIVQEVSPIIGRILDRRTGGPIRTTRVATPPAGAPVHGTPHATEAPEAEVVEPGEDPAAVQTAVSVIARGAAEQRDPAEIADTVNDILSDAQLASLMAMPPDALVADLAERAGGAFPIFRDEAGKAFVREVYRELADEPSPIQPVA